MKFESELLKTIPGITHGFGSKHDPVPNSLLKIWVNDRPSWEQVAGTTIADVIQKNQNCGNADGFYTKTFVPIGVQAADCVPILLSKKDGSQVGALHAGWRGTKAKIVEAFIRKIESQGEKANGWVAAIGPSIRECCYEVSEELVEDFRKTFPNIAADDLSPTFRKLDLVSVNASELERLGIVDIDVIEECTYCSLEHTRGANFHSYRREGGGTRQYSIITRK